MIEADSGSGTGNTLADLLEEPVADAIAAASCPDAASTRLPKSDAPRGSCALIQPPVRSPSEKSSSGGRLSEVRGAGSVDAGAHVDVNE